MMLQASADAEKTATTVRRWTCSPWQVYLENDEILKKMSYTTWLRMLKAECPDIRQSSRLTDYCDHCDMFSRQVLPTFACNSDDDDDFAAASAAANGDAAHEDDANKCSEDGSGGDDGDEDDDFAAASAAASGGAADKDECKDDGDGRRNEYMIVTIATLGVSLPRKMRTFIEQMREDLSNMYDKYFQHLDSKGGVDAGPAELCKAYSVYLNQHTQKYRSELKAAGKKKGRDLIFDLHEKEAKYEHELRWLSQLVGAYQFHKKTAAMQADEARKQISELRKGEAVIWADWKQNLTLPICHMETGDQFWAQARAECSLLGICLYIGQESGPPRKKSILFVSDIIEHTALAAGLQLELIKADLGPMHQYKHLRFWYDCGPHYRTVEMLAFLQQDWSKKHKLPLVTCNYFVEKHGKGDVDAFFSVVNTWVQRCAQVGKV